MMILKKLGIARFLVSVGSLSAVLHAQMVTFKGVASDSVNGMLLDSVTVYAGGSVTTMTNSKGEFTLAAAGTSLEKFEAPVFFPALKWDPANGAFSWNGYSGDVSITVHSLKGRLVARAGSGNNSNSPAYSLSQLPTGMYMVEVATKGQRSRYRINKLKVVFLAIRIHYIDAKAPFNDKGNPGSKISRLKQKLPFAKSLLDKTIRDQLFLDRIQWLEQELVDVLNQGIMHYFSNLTTILRNSNEADISLLESTG